MRWSIHIVFLVNSSGRNKNIYLSISKSRFLLLLFFLTTKNTTSHDRNFIIKKVEVCLRKLLEPKTFFVKADFHKTYWTIVSNFYCFIVMANIFLCRFAYTIHWHCVNCIIQYETFRNSGTPELRGGNNPAQKEKTWITKK